MKTREVLLLLTDRWADWEASYAVAAINSCPKYTVRTIAGDGECKTSMGGMKTAVDYVISEYAGFDNTAMVILPGGLAWQESGHDDIARFAGRVIESGVPLAAICGATIFLGRNGLLDRVRHTGDQPECFTAERGYNGADFYVSAQVVVDRGIITANETAAVEFAYEIFKILAIDDAAELDIWYNRYTHGMVERRQNGR